MIHFACKCGRHIRVSSKHAGKVSKCPDCGQKLRAPHKTSEEDFDHPAASPTLPPRRRTGQADTPTRKRHKKSFSVNRRVVIGGVSLTTLIGCMLLAWQVFFTDHKQDDFPQGVEYSTAPHQESSSGKTGLRFSDPISIDVSNAPILQRAQKFIDLARLPNSSDAIKMINTDRFDQRLRGPHGSAAAVMKNIETKKLLGNFASRSLEGTPGNGAVRHWQILKQTTFEDQPAVLVRYYCEVRAPLSWVKSEELISSLVPSISVKEYWDAVGSVFTFPPQSLGSFDTSIPQTPNSNGLLFPRAGYLLLCFEELNGRFELTDLASPISRLRLSRVAGELYLRDYTVTNFGRTKNPEISSDPITPTIFGALPPDQPNEADWFDSAAYFRRYESPNAKPAQVAELPLSQNKNRTYHLREIATHLDLATPQLLSKIEKFRIDFPNDLGADMVVACLPMIPQETRIKSESASIITASAQRVYESLRDPFMLHVIWTVANSQNDIALINQTLPMLRKSGMETTALHQYLVEQAIASGYKKQVLSALTDVGNYWNAGSRIPAQAIGKSLSQKWAVLEERYARSSQKVADNDVAAQQRSRRPDPRKQGSRPQSRFANPPNRSQTSSSNSNRENRSRSSSNATQVTIKISSSKSFDVNPIARKVAKSLDVRNYQASSRNKEGTIRLSFDGSLDTVKAAIDFGIVRSLDSNTNTLFVELNQ